MFIFGFDPLSLSVGGVAKSQNSSQMNLSGSSSSLTSDASTKAGTVSLRSYGIGGALLHKRIILMTMQHSRQGSRERESQREEAKANEKTEAGQRARRADAGLMLLRDRAGRPVLHPGSPPRLPGLGPITTSHLCQPQLIRPKPPESPIRTRLMSPFRILRERSQSRERLRGVRPHLNEEDGMGEVVSSSPQDERRGRAEQRARRLVSPNPFLWLCRDRHTRRKTVWQGLLVDPVIDWVKTVIWRKVVVFQTDRLSFLRIH